jgi:glycosyltransferase involved in cell wall biosynthesis
LLSVGVCLTTYNRRGMFTRCVNEWLKFHDGPLVVIDDGSDEPAPSHHRYELHYSPDNRGIAVSKNRAIEALVDLGCEHLFIVDDDTVPTRDEWATDVIRMGEPFLIHGFESGPSHWAAKATRHGDLLSWDKPRGCMIYVHAPTVLPIVGGLHTAFGKHGGEHGNWADRIHASGLTSAPHLSLVDSPFYCADEDEADISSVTYNRDWRHVDADRLPMFADYHHKPVPVLVPRRDDGGHRDRLWRWVQDRYWADHPGYRIVEGHHVEGPFNRSVALNLAAQIAGNWDVAIIADSDAWVSSEQLHAATKLARETNRLVAAFDEVHEIDRDTTFDVLHGSGLPDSLPAKRIRTVKNAPTETQSVMLAVPRNLWEQVRGFDPVHNGWGGEDCSFWRACEIATGTPLRVEGPVWMLWHEPASREHQPANAARFQLYRQAQNLADVHRLRA